MSGRQVPFGNEPLKELGLDRPVALRQPRKRAPRPAEKRRRARFVGVTFSEESTPDRLRALALRWGMIAPDGKSANVSAVVEHLLLSQLEAAERGKIEGPE